jgi:hypothetical protein
MRVREFAPRTAWYSGSATLAATPVPARSEVRQVEQGGAAGRRTAPKPSHIRPHARAATASSKTKDVASLVVMGSTALALGLIVYLTDRNASHAVLIPAVAALAGSNLFGAAGQWLPSAIHPFAFSLFTAAALPSRSGWRYRACAAWCVVNVAFELGQHPLVSEYLVSAFPVHSSQSAPGRMLANYFLHGTFDGADILAAVFGAVAAAAVLRFVQHARERDHAS